MVGRRDLFFSLVLDNLLDSFGFYFTVVASLNRSSDCRTGAALQSSYNLFQSVIIYLRFIQQKNTLTFSLCVCICVSASAFLWLKCRLRLENKPQIKRNYLKIVKNKTIQESRETRESKNPFNSQEPTENRWSNSKSLCVFVKRSSSSLSSSSSSYFSFLFSSYLFYVLIAQDWRIHDSFGTHTGLLNRMHTRTCTLTTLTLKHTHMHTRICVLHSFI